MGKLRLVKSRNAAVSTGCQCKFYAKCSSGLDAQYRCRRRCRRIVLYRAVAALIQWQFTSPLLCAISVSAKTAPESLLPN